MTLLRDPEWSQWSDREIAKQARVDKNVVSRLRSELAPTGAQHQSTSRKGADGRVINTANIGKKAKPDPAPRARERAGRGMYEVLTASKSGNPKAILSTFSNILSNLDMRPVVGKTANGNVANMYSVDEQVTPPARGAACASVFEAFFFELRPGAHGDRIPFFLFYSASRTGKPGTVRLRTRERQGGLQPFGEHGLSLVSRHSYPESRGIGQIRRPKCFWWPPAGTVRNDR